MEVMAGSQRADHRPLKGFLLRSATQWQVQREEFGWAGWELADPEDDKRWRVSLAELAAELSSTEEFIGKNHEETGAGDLGGDEGLPQHDRGLAGMGREANFGPGEAFEDCASRSRSGESGGCPVGGAGRPAEEKAGKGAACPSQTVIAPTPNTRTGIKRITK